jgi:hypothetical protein
MVMISADTTRAAAAVVVLLLVAAAAAAGVVVAAAPRRILVDTDMDTDDVLALLYILKHNRSEFDVKVSWCRVTLFSRGSILLRAGCGRVLATTCPRRLAPR